MALLLIFSNIADNLILLAFDPWDERLKKSFSTGISRRLPFGCPDVAVSA
jgi:hypothetical protein